MEHLREETVYLLRVRKGNLVAVRRCSGGRGVGGALKTADSKPLEGEEWDLG